MKRPVHEPERWSGRAGATAGAARQGAPAEDELGALFQRLRQATALDTAGLPLTAARPVRTTGRHGARIAWRLVVMASIVVATGGAVRAARVVWRSMAAREQTLTIPSGSSVTVSGRSHRRLTLTGPARLDLARGDAEEVDVSLAGGMLVAEAGGEPLRVRSGALVVTVPPGGLGRLDGRAAGALSVDALAGELRVAHASGGEGIQLPVAHRWKDERVEALSESPPTPQSQPPSSAPPAPTIEPAGVRPAPAGGASREAAAAPGRSPGDSAAAPGETRWLAQAFHALRVERDAAGALQTLDQYARRFPTGALANEARVARIEALLALGRTGDALPLLLAVHDRQTGLTRDIQITRAELLAEKDRCAEAMPDFDDLLRGDARDAVGERALYGRAACHLRAGRTVLGRQDLDGYLSAYPGGRFAGTVRRAAEDLGTLPPSSP